MSVWDPLGCGVAIKVIRSTIEREPMVMSEAPVKA